MGLCLICAQKNVRIKFIVLSFNTEKLPEELVRQYAAQLVSVLEYL